MQPAIALLEFDSIAVGVRAGDAMVKRAPVEVTYAGTVHPGKYLVLVGGDVASVEEAYAAGLDAGPTHCWTGSSCPPSTPRWCASCAACGAGSTATPWVSWRPEPPPRPSAPPTAAARAPRWSWWSSGSPTGSAARPTACSPARSPTSRPRSSSPVSGLEDPAVLVAQVVIPECHAEMRANLEAATEFSTRLTGGRG
jgi:hypothetical protein